MDTKEAVVRYARGPYFGAALIAAVETGVFEEIHSREQQGNGGHTASTLATSLGLDAIATREVVDVLCVMGLLQWTPAQTLALADAARRHLLTDAPDPLVGYVRGILAPVALRGLLHFEHRLRTGSEPEIAPEDDIALQEHPTRNAKASIDVSRSFAREVLHVLSAAAPWVLQPRPGCEAIKFGDLPCGAGVYGAEIAMALPPGSVEMTFYDVASVLSQAAENHRNLYPEDVVKRFRYFGGDATELSRQPPEPESYDVILSSLTYHLWSPTSEPARAFTDMYYRLAKPGGKSVLVVHEFMRTDGVARDEGRALPWLLELGLHNKYWAWHIDEMVQHLHESGWRDISVIGDVAMTGALIVLAIKP